MRIYVACPITRTTHQANEQRALTACRELLRRGYSPLAPILELTYAIAPAWIQASDAVLCLPGECAADVEVEVAAIHHIPVFHTIDELCVAMPAK